MSSFGLKLLLPGAPRHVELDLILSSGPLLALLSSAAAPDSGQAVSGRASLLPCINSTRFTCEHRDRRLPPQPAPCHNQHPMPRQQLPALMVPADNLLQLGHSIAAARGAQFVASQAPAGGASCTAPGPSRCVAAGRPARTADGGAAINRGARSQRPQPGAGAQARRPAPLGRPSPAARAPAARLVRSAAHVRAAEAQLHASHLGSHRCTAAATVGFLTHQPPAPGTSWGCEAWGRGGGGRALEPGGGQLLVRGDERGVADA
jgi:hypothetical protein